MLTVAETHLRTMKPGPNDAEKSSGSKDIYNSFYESVSFSHNCLSSIDM